MKKITFLILSLFSLSCIAQEKSAFDLYQDTLQSICKNLYTPGKSDTDKQKYNSELLITFERILNTANSFDYPFDSLKKDMAVLLSPDEKFRIINWNVPKNDGTHEYFGFIQMKHAEPNMKNLYPLIDKSAETKNPENAITDNKKWFGMLYYTIIPKKGRNKKMYYTLLGWDGNDKFSTKKIIDVLTFDNNGTPRFGADIFNMQKKYPKRVIFEYSANCSMSLKYNQKKDSIVFDHLAPTQSQLTGQFQYYCGDMSYDGLGFKKGKWNYGIDLNATNNKDYKDKLYNDPQKKSNDKNNTPLKDLKNVPYSEPKDKSPSGKKTKK